MSPVARYAFDEAPGAMRDAALLFQQRFGVVFESITHFPALTLADLHRRGADEGTLMASVAVAADTAPGVRAHTALLTRIANQETADAAARAAYFGALRAVYRSLQPSFANGAVIVAPEREGRILAESLGWLRHGGDLVPHAKRIPYEHGLLVGISKFTRPPALRKLVCIDGAIASGATLIALLDLLAVPGLSIDIYSVHAAREGLRAILRYARTAGWNLRVYAGHVTDGLSPKFYAVSEDGGLVVGDLGDMIADVVAVRP